MSGPVLITRVHVDAHGPATHREAEGATVADQSRHLPFGIKASDSPGRMRPGGQAGRGASRAANAGGREPLR